MSRNPALGLSFAFAMASAPSLAIAQAPSVAVDIAPVHSLVAQVMAGVGSPDLIVPAEASPHEYALRPSQAAALQRADAVFWIGEDLTPWMEGAVETLSENARVVSLIGVRGITVLETREGVVFAAAEEGHDEHGHDEHDHDGHGHDEHGHDGHGHDDHAHEEHGHEEHAHDEHRHEDHGHVHGLYDPHAWLAPQNAAVWLNTIAETLSELDPDNAVTYAANARAAQAQLDTLTADIAARLAPVAQARIVVFHDAYQYFENAFGLQATGAISLSDAADPSPARIAEIQQAITEQNVRCILAEPQFNAGLVQVVANGSSARAGVIDPLGATLDVGPGLYGALMSGMADTLVACLSE